MSGVRVWRNPANGAFINVAAHRTYEPGRWFPENVAVALLELENHIRNASPFDPIGKSEMLLLDTLDAARAQETPATTIHPPAHYQIDTSTPGWNTRYVDAVAKEHGWTRAEAQGRIADGGAR